MTTSTGSDPNQPAPQWGQPQAAQGWSAPPAWASPEQPTGAWGQPLDAAWVEPPAAQQGVPAGVEQPWGGQPAWGAPAAPSLAAGLSSQEAPATPQPWGEQSAWGGADRTSAQASAERGWDGQPQSAWGDQQSAWAGQQPHPAATGQAPGQQQQAWSQTQEPGISAWPGDSQVPGWGAAIAPGQPAAHGYAPSEQVAAPAAGVRALPGKLATLGPAVAAVRRVPAKVALLGAGAVLGVGLVVAGGVALASGGLPGMPPFTTTGGHAAPSVPTGPAPGEGVAQPAPAGSTQIGPTALMLPAGWETNPDREWVKHLQVAADQQGKTVQDAWMVTHPSGGQLVGIVLAPGTHAGKDAILGEAHGQLRAELPGLGDAEALAYAGALPGTATRFTAAGLAEVVVTYMDLPDGGLLSLVASGTPDLFADGTLAAAMTAPTYTG